MFLPPLSLWQFPFYFLSLWILLLQCYRVDLSALQRPMCSRFIHHPMVLWGSGGAFKRRTWWEEVRPLEHVLEGAPVLLHTWKEVNELCPLLDLTNMYGMLPHRSNTNAANQSRREILQTISQNKSFLWIGQLSSVYVTVTKSWLTYLCTTYKWNNFKWCFSKGDCTLGDDWKSEFSFRLYPSLDTFNISGLRRQQLSQSLPQNSQKLCIKETNRTILLRIPPSESYCWDLTAIYLSQVQWRLKEYKDSRIKNSAFRAHSFKEKREMLVWNLRHKGKS